MNVDINRQQQLLFKGIKISLLYLLLVGLLGVFLRYIVLSPIDGVNYKNFLHAHSHIAFLGWVFSALGIGIVYAYLPHRTSSYILLFVLLQVSVIGMLISFPIQGYAFFSITFSTLHIFFSWWFAIKVFVDPKKSRLESTTPSPISLLFIKISLVFMILSAAGPFALGGLMAKGMAATDWYHLSIYFYLHFQYDGWFTFAILGLFFWLLECSAVPFNIKIARLFLWLMAIACVPAYALSALWTKPDAWVYAVAGVSGTIQVLGLVAFLVLLWQIRQHLTQPFTGYIRLAMYVALAAFFLKVVLQLISAIPAVADLAYLVRNFTIAYLHLVFLGFVSFFLIGWLAHQGFINLRNSFAKAGVVAFLIGFVLTELLLVLQPLSIRQGWGVIPFYAEAMVWISLLLPIGALLILMEWIVGVFRSAN